MIVLRQSQQTPLGDGMQKNKIASAELQDASVLTEDVHDTTNSSVDKAPLLVEVPGQTQI